ncbi:MULTISPECIES: hypothetical protein [Vibrio]|uniref:hypothetical protein n=1 Tax=Vibrio TaxID=662 RepID=UPI0020754891|nr:MULTISPECIES: hypothetical protein [Vibrio]USD31366.1 hypothetical protein J8Z27_08705 [Vibrio sp. SCSIO 43186]USD44411.1 hypothetical protein J4N38_09095 [Vibrio sp. SCSIO 43145]USD68489.1 hypothetical protein J4N41_08705 [Vibrio sp. SCSIO 43139]USD96176.1 hypothetical protein CTT30_08825 [Vibrio coralliilyticus]
MNKKITLFSVIAGLLIGGLAAYANSPTMNQNFDSHTQIVVPVREGSELVKMRASLNLKRSGQYELYFLTDNMIGFNTTGQYDFNSYGLSLMPTSAERVIPEGKTLNLMETMFSQRGMHSMEELKVIRIGKEQTILVAPRYSYLFVTAEK